MSDKLNRDLYMYEDFTSSSAQSLVEKLVELRNEDMTTLNEEKNPDIKPIRIHIASYGGYVDYARALVATIKNSIAPVVTIIEGAAFSCGSILSVVGDYRIMSEHARMMIHSPMGGAFGTSSTVKDDAHALEKTEKWVLELYLDHSSISCNELEEAFRTNKQWYIDAKEALRLGLIDEILPEKTFRLDQKKKTFTGKYNGEELTVQL